MKGRCQGIYLFAKSERAPFARSHNTAPPSRYDLFQQAKWTSAII